jgi:pimeloyl-ACP methyl ester carboxylesterase
MDLPYVVLPAIIVLVCTLGGCVSLRKGIQRFDRSARVLASVFALLAVCLLGLAISVGLNAALLYQARHPVPGVLYQVGGQKMRLRCTGSGLPIVLLEAGGGETGLMWAAVQQPLSRMTTTCSYDRAGMGWSSSATSIRDADSIAQELHALLQAANLQSPLVLVGASRGGLYIRDFASHYPTQVAGLVFIDSSTPLQQDDPVYKAVNGRRQVSKWEMLLNQAVFVLGLPRLFGACESPFPNLDRKDAILRAASECHQSFGADIREQDGLEESGKETIHTSFGRTPILVISHDAATELREGMPPALETVTERWQENMTTLSSCGHRVIALGSGHRITDVRPQIVTQAISTFISKLRSEQLGPDYCGVTTHQGQ